MMEDINLHSKTTDPDTANENYTDDVTKPKPYIENINKNKSRMESNDGIVNHTESCKNCKDEIDKVIIEQDIISAEEVSDDSISENKPNAPVLEASDVMAPIEEFFTVFRISRPVNDTLFPAFLKGGHGGLRSDTPRDLKEVSRSMAVAGKGSVNLGQTGGGNSSHKPVIHVSSREDVKLKQDSTWTRSVRENLSEEELRTQELYKKFKEILNKLTPQKLDTLVTKVWELGIDSQKKKECVIDLLFEKALAKPIFSETYAKMCLKLSRLRVPSDNNRDIVVSFRGLIISKCQTEFETGKLDEQLMKLQKESAETTEPAKKKVLQMMINKDKKKIKMRAVANIRFIGELYKLKMLTIKIMNYCIKRLIDPLEEKNLECLCVLLTTIGKEAEKEDGTQLDSIFKEMQEIVKRESNKISGPVKAMIQDVIDLRNRKWLDKSAVDAQPKMMDQIKIEAEQQQRLIRNPDTANENYTDEVTKPEPYIENINKNKSRMESDDGIVNHTESCKNCKDEIDKVIIEQDIISAEEVSDDSISETKPNAPVLEASDVMAPIEEFFTVFRISRPVNDTLFPAFLKGGHGGLRNDTPRDLKKVSRSMAVAGKGSVNLGQTGGGNSSHKPVIHVSSREDVKLKQDSTWTRSVRENLSEEELRTQELFKKFKEILNKLTPQKLDTLVTKVWELGIDSQKKLECVIDLLFEKALAKPIFSETYAKMCLKLSRLRVPSDNNRDIVVSFRGLIISKCQTEFETGKLDEQLMKLQKESAETTEPAKKKVLQMMINKDKKKIKMRAVAIIRFIGELYKLKMLTIKIMNYCIKRLIDPLEEKNLECLCVLLTTIGKEAEKEDGTQLDSIFKKMQEIVKRESNKISGPVKAMIQDVIDLRNRKWLDKSAVDAQPKMMDQIKIEAEQQQRLIRSRENIPLI